MKTDLLPNGCIEVKWDDWKNYPTWATERQLKAERLIPQRAPVGAVWYVNKYMRSYEDGHWLYLFDRTTALPKVLTEAQAARRDKAAATALTNRTCIACGTVEAQKIKVDPRLCDACWTSFVAITKAREYLANEPLVLDTETTGLDIRSSDILSISILDYTGQVLLDTFVKPPTPIIEESGHWEDSDWGGPRYRATAFEVNAISNAMVESAPTFADLYERLQALWRDRAIVAYNVDFDRSMIRAHIHRFDLPEPTWTGWGCMMETYAVYANDWSEKYQDYRFVSLTNACLTEDISIDEAAHTALGDCRRTLALMQKLATKKLSGSEYRKEPTE